MEFLLCLLIAALMTGVRPVTDAWQASRGVEPPHLAKARLKAAQQKQKLAAAQAKLEARGIRPGEDKPTFADVVRVYKGQLWQDAIDHRERTAAEKRQQKAADQAAAGTGEPAVRVRPSLRDRIKRFGRLLIDPVGEKPQPVTDQPDNDEWLTPDPDEPMSGSGVVHAGSIAVISGTPDGRQWSWACRTCPGRGFDFPTQESATEAARTHPCRPESNGSTTAPTEKEETVSAPAAGVRAPRPHTWYCPDCRTPMSAQEYPRYNENDLYCPDCKQHRNSRHNNPQRSAPAGDGTPDQQGDPMTQAQSGEAVNYETAMAELDALEAKQQAHLDEAMTALKNIQDAKASISNTRATYRPAVDAAGSIHEHLTALNLDAETIAQTGTIVDAMPPNKVDVMFDQLEAMEVDAQQQVTNAEAALAATDKARQVIVGKYGDAHATVAGELAGDSRFLAAAGAQAA